MQGLALTPDDAWCVHSAAHVYEMKGEADKGLKFMESREKDWKVQPMIVLLQCFSDESHLSNLVLFCSLSEPTALNYTLK